MCDTFVVTGSNTHDGSLIFGKNSDREVNELQVLEYHPAREFPKDAVLECTYETIPQVTQSNAVLISRPFWMWGAEIGANDKGVVIGNEAVFTRMPVRRKAGLTGMDMLRLALERTDSPEGAVEEMIRLLHDIGQGGVCGYKDRRMAYHNSFIIAGKGRAWVLETAGPFWAAKQVKGFHAISNALSIGTDFDRIHPDVLETARKKNWLRSGEEPDFAGIFSDTLYTRFSAARRRQERALEHIQACLHKRESEERAAGGRSGFSVKDAFSLLRDHGGDAGYRPDKDFLGKTLCAHGANAVTRKATQTTASMVAHLQEHEETYWCTAGSAPCLSTFKPVWFQGEVLPDLGEENGEGYQYDSTWWQHERLHRAVLRDYRSRFDYFRPYRDELERGFFENVYLRPQSAGIAFKDKFSITLHAFKECESAERTWREAIEGMEIRRKARFLYRCFWRKRNKEADIPV